MYVSYTVYILLHFRFKWLNSADITRYMVYILFYLLDAIMQFLFIWYIILLINYVIFVIFLSVCTYRRTEYEFGVK